MAIYPFAELLLEHACAARELSFCPYSGFSVGAALRTADGRIARGCNVENVSFGLSMCAERCAIFNSAPFQTAPPQIEAIAVVGGPNSTSHLFGETRPCGACLQVLAEFAGPECHIICADIFAGEPLRPARFYTLRQLLPLTFGGGTAKR